MEPHVTDDWQTMMQVAGNARMSRNRARHGLTYALCHELVETALKPLGYEKSRPVWVVQRKGSRRDAASPGKVD
jgi:hypothetical protein